MAQRLKDTYDCSSAFAYAGLPGFGCVVDDYGTENVTLDDNYVKQALEAVPEQLARAGARIAYLSGPAFAKKRLATSLLALSLIAGRCGASS